MIAVAGLDLSHTNTGVAVICDDGVFTYSYGYELARDATEAEKILRQARILRFIQGILEKHSVVRVGCESYAYATGIGLPLSGELTGQLKLAVFLKTKSPIFMFPPKEARRFVFGHQPKGKKAIVSELKKLGYAQPSNHDEADALVIALTIHRLLNQPWSISEEVDLKLLLKVRRNDVVRHNPSAAKPTEPGSEPEQGKDRRKDKKHSVGSDKDRSKRMLRNTSDVQRPIGADHRQGKFLRTGSRR